MHVECMHEILSRHQSLPKLGILEVKPTDLYIRKVRDVEVLSSRPCFRLPQVNKIFALSFDTALSGHRLIHF